MVTEMRRQGIAAKSWRALRARRTTRDVTAACTISRPNWAPQTPSSEALKTSLLSILTAGRAYRTNGDAQKLFAIRNEARANKAAQE